ncbi:putative ribonuclease H-like domain-containing protein [Tanacetum coccineum]
MVKPVWNNAQRVNHQNFAKKTHPCAKKNLVPKAVLMKSSLVSINTARQNISKTAVSVNIARQVNTTHSKITVNAARPMSYLSKISHSTVKRPIHKNTAFKNSNIDQRVNTVSGKKINTSRPKALVNAVKGNNVNAVKASEEIDGGYVAFGGNPKGEKITGKDTIKTENSINLPLHLLHMDLFGPTFVKGLMKKMYCLIVTNDYSRFTRVFFLATTNETSGILKSFITGIKNLVDHKVKLIRCDNGIEFENKEMNQFCKMKGILRQYSVARTPQQNGVAERRNRALIETARTMLADSKLPTTFWAEAVNTACYVQDRVLVVKPHNKTPYELFHGRTPTLCFMRPFGCPVTILNTIDHFGKFDGKADEGFFVGYFLNSKAFSVFNSRTRIVEENLHIRFSESTPNVVGSGPDWLFDIDALTRTMNYEPVVAGTQSNGFTGTKASDNLGQARKETKPVKNYILLPLWPADPPYSQYPKSSQDDGSKPMMMERSTNKVNAVGGKTSIELPFDPTMPALEDYRDNEDDGAEANMNNLDTTIQVSPIPTTRIHKDHPLDQVIGDLQSVTQQVKCLKKNQKVIHAFEGSKRIEAMQEASTIQVTKILDFSGFTKWEKGVYPYFPNRVYKVEKALYGLHQAPRAWYETLSTYMLDNGFQRGKIDKTLFIKSQDKYVGDILKKFGFTEVKTSSTPIETQKPLLKDEDGKDVDVQMYRSMIGSLMYLTSSRPDIMYLKGQPKLGLSYPKDSPFDLVAYTDSDYAGASLDRKSIIGDTHNMVAFLSKPEESDGFEQIVDFLHAQPIKYALTVNPTIYTSCIKQLWSTVKAKTINREVQLHALVDGKKIIVTESTVRRDLQLEDAECIGCLPNSAIFEELTRMGYEKISQKLTFYKAFFSPQWKFLIHTILQCLSSKTTAWNEFSSTMASAIICLATNQKFNFSKYIFESMVKNLDNMSEKLLTVKKVLVPSVCESTT